MLLGCPHCRRNINVPDDRAKNPNLKIKCTCGVGFPIGDAAPPGPAGKPAPPAPSPPVGPGAAVQAPSAPAPARAPVASTEVSASASPPSPPPVAGTAIAPTPPAPPTPATPQPAPRPPIRPLVSPPAAGTAANPSARVARRRPGANVRTCAQHPGTPSDYVCPACSQGHCAECVQVVRTAGICPKCNGLCLSMADYEAREERERMRARSLMSELGAILRYPLGDPLAYALLSIVVGVFAALSQITLVGGGIAFVLSQGLLMAYAFNAVTRVSDGHWTGFIPEIADVTALVNPVRLGLAATLVSSWLLIVVVFFAPAAFGPADLVFGARTTQIEEPMPSGTPPEDVLKEIAEDTQARVRPSPTPEPAPVEPEPAQPSISAASTALWLGLLFAGLLWKLAYSPVALIVAALNRTSTALSGILQTLNPVLGVQTIVRMGAIYWQAMAIYALVTFVQLVLGLALGMIPLAGVFLRAFVDAYAYLAIGCALGSAVFKTARELGFE